MFESRLRQWSPACLIAALCAVPAVQVNANSSAETVDTTSVRLMGTPTPFQQSTVRRSVRQTHDFLPNDPLSEKQWNLMSHDRFAGAANSFNAQHNAPQATVVVAVVDSGMRLDHEDYIALPGYDFISDPVVANDGDGRDPDPSDPGDWVNQDDIDGALAGTCALTNSRWHGTAIAGIIGAQTENLTGIAGAARHVALLPVRVTGKCGGYVNDLIDGIRWAAGLRVKGVPDNPTPARVINLSVGFSGACSPSLQRAIDDAVTAGAIVVTAATNYAVNLDLSPHAPASCSQVLTVGASLRNGSLAPYSATGTALFLLGPGGSRDDGIITTDNEGTREPSAGSSYGYQYGTSLAAAHVSAAAATLLSASPALTATQVRVALQQSAVPSADSQCARQQCGAGLLNTRKALQLLLDGDLQHIEPQRLTPQAAAASASPETFTGAVSFVICLLLLLRPFVRRHLPLTNTRIHSE
jgi:serine protease